MTAVTGPELCTVRTRVGAAFHIGSSQLAPATTYMYTSGNEEALRSPVCVAGRVDQTPDSPRTRSHSVHPGLFSGGIRRPMCGACVHPPLRRQPDGLNAAWLDGDSQAAAAAGFTSGRTGNLLSLSSGFLWPRAPQPAPPPTFACALAQQLSAFPQPRLPPAAHASSAPTR